MYVLSLLGNIKPAFSFLQFITWEHFFLLKVTNPDPLSKKLILSYSKAIDRK